MAAKKAGKNTIPFTGPSVTMKAIIANGFGEPDEVLSMSEIPRPVRTKGSGEMLVRVLACSFTPGDWRMLSGQARLLKKPEGWPYVPCLDIAGIVEGVDEDENDQVLNFNSDVKRSDTKNAAAATPTTSERFMPRFKVGDEIIGTWDGMFGAGGLAEYALVKTSLATLKPKNISFCEGAALANSPNHALKVIELANVCETDRVLVLGGSGGVGLNVIQMARSRASFIAATSSDTSMLHSLGVDRAIDYRSEHWWEVPEFLHEPFDVIIDCAEGRVAWGRACQSRVLKRGGGRALLPKKCDGASKTQPLQGGRFIAVVPNSWLIEMQHWWQVPGWFLPVVGRRLRNRLNVLGAPPRYEVYMDQPGGRDLAEVAALAAAGRLRPVLEPGSPRPFTAEGARGAFRLLASRRAKGKIVVQVAER